MLKVVHKKVGPTDEVKEMWQRIEKKFWDRKANEKIQNFLTGTRDVRADEKQLEK